MMMMISNESSKKVFVFILIEMSSDLVQSSPLGLSIVSFGLVCEGNTWCQITPLILCRTLQVHYKYKHCYVPACTLY